MSLSIYKNLVKKNLPFLYKVLVSIKKKFANLMRLKDVLLMMISLLFFPRYVYLFSTRNFFVPTKNRNNSSINHIPYSIYLKKSNKQKRIPEANFIAVGDSFNLNEIKNFKNPTFLSCFWNTIQQDENDNLFYIPEDNLQSYILKRNKNIFGKLKTYENHNLIYIMTKKKYFKRLIDKGVKVLNVQIYHEKSKDNFVPSSQEVREDKNYYDFLSKNNIESISLIHKFYKSNPTKKYSHWVPTGSVLPNIFALSTFVDKINIYGWDFYFDKNPKDLNLFQILHRMYSLSPHESTSFESSIINYYYAFKLNQLPNIKIYGRLGQVSNKYNLINKIEKVIYK